MVGSPDQPNDGSTNIATYPLLKVWVFDPDGDFVDVHFIDVQQGVIDTVYDVSSSSSASIAWPGLKNNTQYSWYVIVDDGQYAATSPIWHFTTGWNNPPTFPTGNPYYPSNSATGIATNPVLQVKVSDTNTWSAVDVSFYNASNNKIIGVDTAVSGVYGTIASDRWSGLAPSKKYYWYVIVSDGQYSVQSSTWSFTTGSGAQTMCGDANGDHTVDISDCVYLIQYIFGGGPALQPLCSGDANGDGFVDISDAVYLIAYIFGGGPPPVPDCCG
jgi:hypothetical protein